MVRKCDSGGERAHTLKRFALVVIFFKAVKIIITSIKLDREYYFGLRFFFFSEVEFLL